MADVKVMVTETATMDRDVTATTPGEMPNVRLVVMPVLTQVVVRVLRTYIQSLLGFLGATAIGVLPGDPLDPQSAAQKILLAAGLALFPTLVALLQNLLELLTKWDTQHPEWRA